VRCMRPAFTFTCSRRRLTPVRQKLALEGRAQEPASVVTASPGSIDTRIELWEM
jgi:hypothetical protein